MRLEDLDYELPESLIAQHPTERREDARLLVVDRARGTLTDSRIADIGQWLRAGDRLALNETRVRPARLMMRRVSGGKVELLFVRPEPTPPPQPTPPGTATAAVAAERWRVLARPARHAAVGAILTTPDDALAVQVVEASKASSTTCL